MKLPPPRQSAGFIGSAKRTNRTDERVEKEKHYTGGEPSGIPPGSAAVTSTRGFKHWFSTREAGITVESTMAVTLSCGRGEDEVFEAGEEAGKMAERLAVQGCEDMDLYIKKFVDGVGR